MRARAWIAIRHLASALLFLVGGIAARADTPISGTISSDAEWTTTGSPYILTGSVLVQGSSAPVLTIRPGVIVKFNSGASLSIGSSAPGGLQVLGAAGNPVIFTANIGTPSPGYWGGVQLYQNTTATSQISYATVSYGGISGSFGGLRIYRCSPALDNVTASNNAHAGITVEGPAAAPLITNSTLTFNPVGLTASTQASPSLQTVTISNCTSYALSVDPTVTLGTISNLTLTNNPVDGMQMRGGSSTTVSATWKKVNDLAYIVTSGVGVGSPAAPPAVLTIEAGLTLKFTAGASLGVSGSGSGGGDLQAVGTPAAPITFTANSGTAGPGYWAGIGLVGGTTATSRIAYATVRYGGQDFFNGGIHIENCSPTIENTTVLNNAYAGISVRGTGASPVISGSTLTGNAFGLRAENLASPTISNSTISNNLSSGLVALTQASLAIHHVTFSSNATSAVFTSNSTVTLENCNFANNDAGIVNVSGPVVTARFNWWNSASGPSGSGPGSGQSVSPGVRFEPWLGSTSSQPNFFNSFSQVDQTFNPSIGINTRLSFGTTLAGSWTATFRTAADIPIRTMTGSGATGTVTWDGKNDALVDEPTGTYIYQIESVAGGDVAAPVRGRAILDRARQLTITGLAASPLFFSPNADGIQDTTTLTGTANFENVTWTINIKNASSAIVRTATGSGPAVSFTWDGKDNSGQVQPDGVYTCEVTVLGGTASFTGSTTATLDNTPPVAIISAPTDSQVISNVYRNGVADFDIVGTATDTNFDRWLFGFGSTLTQCPLGWVAGSSFPLTNSRIMTWPTLQYDNGVYYPCLRVWDKAGNRSIANFPVTLGNFVVSQAAYQVNGAAGGTVLYTSVVPFELTETLYLKNASGQTVRTLVNAARAAGPPYSDAWDGRNDSGDLLPDAPYFWIATATAGASSMTWDLSNQSRIELSDGIVNPTFSSPFDSFNNAPLVMNYNLANASRTSVQVHPGDFSSSNCAGIRSSGGECLTEWEYEAAGPHSFIWAETRPNGAFLPGQRYSTVVFMNSWFFRNTVVLFGSKPTLTSPRFTPAVYGPTNGTQSLQFNLATYQSQSVSLTVQFLNHSSVSVLKTITVPTQAPGTVTVTWDGRADNGMLVAPGGYTAIITVTDSLGNVATLHAVTMVVY